MRYIIIIIIIIIIILSAPRIYKFHYWNSSSKTTGM